MNQNTAIQLFNYEDHDMRVVELEGEPWIVAKDVCDILELSNSRKAVQRVDPEDLVSLEVTSGGQRREMNAVNESGFYALVFDSRKPGAKKFKREGVDPQKSEEAQCALPEPLQKQQRG